MYSQLLKDIEKQYAEKYRCGLPLTVEQLFNAVVDWMNNNFVKKEDSNVRKST